MIRIKKDKHLTTMAKAIFGKDIVKSAYVATSACYTEKDIQSELRLESFKSVKKSIDNGGKEIIIEFNNGNAVLITNSEWGSIQSVNLEAVKNEHTRKT